MASKPTPKLQSPPIRKKTAKETKSENKSKAKINSKPNKNSGGGNNHHGEKGKGGGGNKNDPPSPWLNPDQEPIPNSSAGFVEYLRWMREPNAPYKDDTKVQILQIAQENAKYNRHLERLTQRTKLIAGKNNTFEVYCPWRIRVGGHRGPEQILLPAFDTLGIPYIPSSTLRGVARNQAIREFMTKKKLDWQKAEIEVASYFGSLEAEEKDRIGKVVFLDAYPLPSKTGGLSLDIATSIWNWDNGGIEYKEPNPNPFLSLEKSTFIIGLRLVSNCNDDQILDQIKRWLVKGLQAGIGSQINAGYGKLSSKNHKIKSSDEFLRLQFWLEGQLIHGAKKFNLNQPYQTDRNGNLKPNTSSIAEVRPNAFKSMLRYWFRAFALGVMSPQEVEKWECQLFGAINPIQKWGWIEVNILEGQIVREEEEKPRNRNDRRALIKWKEAENWGEQEGILTLSYSEATPSNSITKEAISQLLENLAWLMFHLGGVGQGARRPRYSRKNRNHLKPPFFRGSNLILDSDLIENENSFWYLPETIRDFQRIFRKRIRGFYSALEIITTDSQISQHIQSPLEFGNPTRDNWYEGVDKHCRIVVCSGQEKNDKPYALSILHSDNFKVRNRREELDYDPNLCGQTAKPSPILVRDFLDDFQVVTVFGATVDPRKSYLKALKDNADRGAFLSIFPLPSNNIN